MKAIRNTVKTLGFGLLLAAMLSCEQPFKAGLGGVVDLHPPVIYLDDPLAGGYIWDVWEFKGTVMDDYRLAGAEFRITNYGPMLTVDGVDQPNPYYGENNGWLDLGIKAGVQTDTWSLKIDTRLFEDGDFKIKLRVWDAEMEKYKPLKPVETEEIVIFIKNEPPHITMALPTIVEGPEKGQLGGGYLNYGYPDFTEAAFPRVMDADGLMIGLISDGQGVNILSGTREVYDETIETFPPQIRFWQLPHFDDKGASHLGIPIFAGVPTLDQLPWESIDEHGSHADLGAHSMQFTYPVPVVNDRYYGFQIRAQSRDYHGTMFEYPRNSWTDDDWKSLSLEQQTENSYVVIYVRAPAEFPLVERWNLEDFTDLDKWNDPTPADPGYYSEIDDVDLEGDHAYVDQLTSYKNGAFAIRIKAYHSEGINTAAIYYENEGTGEKGRFIWDPATSERYPGFPSGSVVPITSHYNAWGLADPNSRTGESNPSIRSFIFTYSNTGGDRSPGGGGITVANRSTIQQFVGERWLTGGTPRIDTYHLEEQTVAADWKDLDFLPEGKYLISVFARGGLSSTLNDVPLTFNLVIDREAPEISLESMVGGFENIGPGYDPLNPAYTVNGVIKPQFRIIDERPVDSRLRTAASDYFLRGDQHGFEQYFIVISDDDKAPLDMYFGNNKPWLPDPALNGSLRSVSGITILKNGPIFDSSCFIKTSPVYFTQNNPQGEIVSDGTETDILADGKYWIYVFARDNAFNVGHRAFPIIVDKDSDRPWFNFSVGVINENVNNPNSGEPDSFEYVRDGIRGVYNKFGENSVINLRLNDDDSLDLGDFRSEAQGGESSVSVSMVGSHVVDGITVPWPGATYRMYLTQDEIKAAFGEQGTQSDPQDNDKLLRIAVKEQNGEISQFVLLNHLKRNEHYNYLFGAPAGESVNPIPANSLKNNFTGLPDGLYQITISVSDYTAPDIKLIMPGEIRHASAASRTESFWIAVDNNPPQLNRDLVTPAVDSFISATDTVFIKGKVSDVNGPISIGGLRVLQDGRTDITNQVEFGAPVSQMLSEPAGNSEKWEYDFSIPVYMKGKSGKFTYVAVFTDRFLNEARLEMQYSIDNEPPTVSLNRRIDTFSRKYDDVVLTGPQLRPGDSDYQDELKTRLANKVISFTITANDDFGVTGLRWWFLPVNTGSIGSGEIDKLGPAYSLIEVSGGRVLEFDAYPSELPVYAAKDVVHYFTNGLVTDPLTLGGAYGEIDVTKSNRTIVIDTEKLFVKDGEYRLHIIAIDAAGNISRLTEDANKHPTSSMYQEVFLLQDEDRPYFQNITPSGDMVVSDSGMILRGTILEDDGFLDGDAIMAGSVRIWLLNNDDDLYTFQESHLGTYDPAQGKYTSDTLAGYIGPKVVPISMLSPSGSKNLNFNNARLISNSNQEGIFTASDFGVISGEPGSGNGRKHIIIEATDSPNNKIDPPDEPRPPRVSRRKHFTFIYDTVPPTVRLDLPKMNQSFGAQADDDMFITGFFEDANLVRHDNGRYEIAYLLDTWDEARTKILDPAWVSDTPFTGYNLASQPPVTNGIRKYFHIPANYGAEMLEYDDSFDDGPHLLTVSVTDAGGRTGSFSVTFIKDGDRPNFEFTNIVHTQSVTHNPTAGVDLEINAYPIHNWWDPGTMDVTTWNRNKLRWLNAPVTREGQTVLQHPLSVIYYDTNGKPVLTGTFDDDESDVDMDSFEYWFDDDDAPVGIKETKSVNGSGRNYRWEIWLTHNGEESGNALSDGIHTIRFKISDKSDNTLKPDIMYAFRIDSKAPEVAIDDIDFGNTIFPIGTAPTVLGRSTGFDEDVFTISGTAKDANLKEVHLVVRNSETGAVINARHFAWSVNANIGNWSFEPVPVTNKPEKMVLKWEYELERNIYDTRMSHGVRYDVIVTAVDEEGLVSEEAVWSFTKDTSAPVISFNGVKSTAIDSYPVDVTTNDDRFNRISSENVRIQGSVIDDTSGIKILESQVWRWNWNAATLNEGWVIIQPWGSITDLGNGESANVQWTKNLSNNMPFVRDGTWWVETDVGASPDDWAVLDSGGWALTTVDTAIPWQTGDVVSESSAGIWQITRHNGSTVSLVHAVQQRSEGLYRIRVRAKDSSWIANGDDGWITGTNGSSGNPALSQTVYFYIDRSNPNPVFDPDVQPFYSSVSRGGRLEFSGTVSDLNRFRSVYVDIIDQAGGAIPGITAVVSESIRYPANSNLQPQPLPVWKAVFTVDPVRVPDGHYRVRVTATDMANMVNVVTKNFTLDNRPPEAEISMPHRNRNEGIVRTYDGGEYQYASEVVMGGEDAEITGTNKDTSSGSVRTESGVDEMWYHLGFLGNVNADTGKFPTQIEIERTVIPAGQRDRGEYNELFTKAAEAIDDTDPYYRGAWFKLDGDAPRGFVIAKSDVYDWVMQIPNRFDFGGGLEDVGGLKQYARPINIKGKPYNEPGVDGPKMALPVPVELLAQVRETGIMRMPLYIRVADKAGNISYTCRDIWIYPDGDIPRTTVLNPQNGDAGSPRGGTISADGIARNNWAVNSVIFRVKVDGRNEETIAPSDDLLTMDTPTQPNGGIVTFAENRMVDNQSELKLLDDNGYTRQGWYYANPEAPVGSDEMPWNFSFNTLDEIKNLIPKQGFHLSGTTNNLIRVYLEVFAFRGNGTATRISVGDDGDETQARPYVRVFYMQDSAPTITGWKIGKVSNMTPPTGEYLGAGSHVFAGMFAIRATLDAGEDQTISQISIRRPQEEEGGWVDVWDGKLLGVHGVRVTADTAGGIPSGQRYYFDMYFDSLRTSLQQSPNPENVFSLIKDGNWRNQSGRYPVEVRIRDHNSPPAEAIYVFDIGVDNFAPLADPRLSSQGNKRAAGTNQDFMGRVFDYSSALMNASSNAPREIDSVYVWFTKSYSGGDEFININNGRRSSQAGNTPVFRNVGGTFIVGRTAIVEPAGGGDPSGIAIEIEGTGNQALVDQAARIAYPAVSSTDAAYAVENGWVRHISEARARPGSRMLWIPNRNWDITWVFNIDTTVLPDGLITLNYVVTDKAGNASFHKQESIYVRNKYPQIDRITLYTDNDGIGAVYTTHSTVNVASTEFVLENHRDSMFSHRTGGSAYEASWADGFGYLNSGFISKNEYVGFKIESSLGNAFMNYRLQYVERGSYSGGAWIKDEPMLLDRNNLKLMLNNKNPDHADFGKYSNLYTIAWQGDYNPNRWQAIGAPTPDTPIGTHFVLQINDIGPDIAAGDIIPDNYIPDSSARVWAYRPVAGLEKTAEHQERPDPNGIINLPVLPNNWDSPIEPGHGFNFHGEECFDPVVLNGKIAEFDGSYPGDAVRNNPSDTAFFLIKAWDTVNPAEDEDGQLYDAVVIGMNIYLQDDELPEIRIYDLNPYTETEVTGNNVGEANKKITMENALYPRGIGENILRGGLYNVNTVRELLSSGHIEPKHGTNALQPRVRNADGVYDSILPADGFVQGDRPENTYHNGTSIVSVARDMVSGKVILRGYAHDNQLIREIRVHIGENPSNDLHDVNSPAGKAMAILRIDENAARTIVQSGVTIRNPLFGILQPVEGKDASVYQELHWKDGHSAEWAYVWDTETEPNADGSPAEDIGIWVAVIDHLGDSKNGLASDDDEDDEDNYVNKTFKNMMRVDIVPYITGFLRYGYIPRSDEEWDDPSPRYATRRSRQGWFSFYQGEQNIAVQGYNLIGGTMPTSPLRLLSGTGGVTETSLVIASDPAPTVNRIVFSVPIGAVSGQIVLNTGVTVGGSTEALNHRSNPNRSWNREENNFTPGSDLWTNKPHVHIWRSQQNDPGPLGSGGVTGQSLEAPVTYFGNGTGPGGSLSLMRPAMALEYASGQVGRLTGVYALYGMADSFYARNDGLMRMDGVNSGKGFFTDGSGLPGTAGDPPREPYLSWDVSFYNGSAANGTAAVAFEGDGDPRLYIRNGTNFATFTQATATETFTPTKRFQNSRALRSNGVSHATTYDNFYNSLLYTTGTARSYLDGSRANTGGGLESSSNAGLFSAIDYDSDGQIVAYYDQANDTIRMAMYGNDVESTGTPFTTSAPSGTQTALSSGTRTGTANFPGTSNSRRWYNINASSNSLIAGDVVYVTNNTTNNINNATARYVLAVNGNNVWLSNDFIYTGVAATDQANVWDNDTTRIYYYILPINNQIESRTRIFNRNNHGLTLNQTVIVNNVRRTVLWRDTNNFKLSAVEGGTTPMKWDGLNTSASEPLAYARTITVTPVVRIQGWGRSYLLPQSHPLFRGSGRYVSMKVDKENRIHLAFYNSLRNTVVYAVGTRTGGFEAYSVDNVVRGGVWTDISIDNEGNPWIVYGDSSRIGTYDGARIAYRTNSNTANGIRFDNRSLTDPVTGADITGWEAVTMPADYLVNDDRLNIEVWPPSARATLGTRDTARYGSWDAAVGYGSDMFRLAYFYRPTWKDDTIWN